MISEVTNDSASALIVIDVQNDYFPGGALPQWEVDTVSARIAEAVRLAEDRGWLVIAVRHVSIDSQAKLFRADSDGAALHPSVSELLKDKPLIVKRHADSFFQTGLAGVLNDAGVSDVYLCGMMTQNCVTHTALSPEAMAYRVHVWADCCSAPSEMIHKFAVTALSARFDVGSSPCAKADMS